MGKKQVIMNRKSVKKNTIHFNFEDVARVAGTTHAAVLKASYRKCFNSKDLWSLIAYINRTRKKKKLPELESNVSINLV